jgi:hypothetical protein
VIADVGSGEAGGGAGVAPRPEEGMIQCRFCDYKAKKVRGEA